MDEGRYDFLWLLGDIWNLLCFGFRMVAGMAWSYGLGRDGGVLVAGT